MRFLYDLRDVFGKTAISSEDGIRLESIRSSHAVAGASQAAGYTPERFLQEARGKITISFAKDPLDPRALELINKTNQFNLNGKRHTEASWRQSLSDPESFLMLVSYEDRFGPLGKIAVVTGKLRGDILDIHEWVMSCRAFSRRIEYGCLLAVPEIWRSACVLRICQDASQWADPGILPATIRKGASGEILPIQAAVY